MSVSTNMFVYVDELFLTLATVGAGVAVVGGVVSGIAFGLRHGGHGSAFLGVWMFGMLLSMLSMAVSAWWPATLAAAAFGGAIILGSLTAIVLAVIRRPHYRRMASPA